MSLRVSVTTDTKEDATLFGDPDLYVSTQTDKPGPSAYIWKADEAGGADSVVMDVAHPQFSKTWYWIAVHAYEKPAKYIIKAEEGADTASTPYPLSFHLPPRR
jgi:hypothetical protein